MKKILILGGEGFLGLNIADVLSGEFTCTSVGLTQSVFASQAKFFKADPYEQIIPGKFDVVIQLIDMQSDNVIERESKLLSHIEISPGGQFVFLSSASIYAAPDTDYAKRKKMLEEFYGEYCKTNGIRLMILRLFNIFGFYQFPNRKGSFVANLLYNFYAGEETNVDDLDAKRDFIYAKDAARCIEKVIALGTVGMDDLATNELRSYRTIIAKLEKIVNGKIKIIDKKIPETHISPTAKSGIIKQIKLTPLDTALTETAAFYKKNWRKIGESNVK